jgi:hypothetical protein
MLPVTILLRKFEMHKPKLGLFGKFGAFGIFAEFALQYQQ